MLHVDVKNYGNIPDGGWRYVGRAQRQTRPRSHRVPHGTRNAGHEPRMGTAFVHTVVVNHSRVAHAEIRNDGTAATAIAVLPNAVAWFAERGVAVERILSDNGDGLQVPPDVK